MNSECKKLGVTYILLGHHQEDLIENFLKTNKEFDGKSKAVQYLVDESIAQANIKKGCEKIEFIDSNIKDSYLEKFKIYCLVFNDKKPQAQLLLDLLREQKQSDQFFDDKKAKVISPGVDYEKFHPVHSTTETSDINNMIMISILI